MGKTQRAVGNHILFDCYAPSAPFMFTPPFLVIIFLAFVTIVAFGSSPGWNCCTITRRSKLMTSPRGTSRPRRGLSERNGSCEVPAPSIYQELPRWKPASRPTFAPSRFPKLPVATLRSPRCRPPAPLHRGRAHPCLVSWQEAPWRPARAPGPGSFSDG